MDSFELNKILGAVLGTCLVLLSLNITAGALFSPQKPAKPGYNIVVPEKPAEDGKPAGPEEPIGKLLASADLKRGEAAAKKCMACHTFQKGGANLVGPNLWGIVNRPKASVANFNYSQAMRAKGGNWGFEELNEYLANPRKMVPGTIMNFPGITRGSERADLILYLNSLSDNPAPLPKAAAAPTSAPVQAAQAGQAVQR
jgi:cytochrome c